jgi:uncharacterized protein (DUF433 family)
MARAAKNISEGWETRIVCDPKICHGEATFRGTRVLLRTVLGGLASGASPEDILEAFRSLSPEDIKAAIRFAAASAAGDLRRQFDISQKN